MNFVKKSRLFYAPMLAMLVLYMAAPITVKAAQKAAADTVAVRANGGSAPAEGPRLALPPPQALIVLIRSTLVALSQANTTGNYTVLHQLGSKKFQISNSPEHLSQLFAPFRSYNLDLTSVVFITPQLLQAPEIKDGRMRLVGVFPSQPMMVTFDMMFEPDQGSWKLFGLGVNLARAPSGPAGNAGAMQHYEGAR